MDAIDSVLFTVGICFGILMVADIMDHMQKKHAPCEDCKSISRLINKKLFLSQFPVNLKIKSNFFH